MFSTVCDEKLDEQAIEVLVHTYGKWATVTESKIGIEGLKERVCLGGSSKKDEMTEDKEKVEVKEGKIEEKEGTVQTGDTLQVYSMLSLCVCICCGSDYDCKEKRA